MILIGETEVVGEKHYTAWVVDERMNMDEWWNDTDRGKQILEEKPVSVPLFSPQILRGLDEG